MPRYYNWHCPVCGGSETDYHSGGIEDCHYCGMDIHDFVLNSNAAEQARAADRDPGAQPSTVDEDRNSEVRGG